MEGQWSQSCTWLEFSFDGKPNKISPKQTPLLKNGAHVLPQFENNCTSSCITVWNGFFLLKTFSIHHAIMFLTLKDRYIAFSSSCFYWFVLKRISIYEHSHPRSLHASSLTTIEAERKYVHKSIFWPQTGLCNGEESWPLRTDPPTPSDDYLSKKLGPPVEAEYNGVPLPPPLLIILKATLI